MSCSDVVREAREMIDFQRSRMAAKEEEQRAIQSSAKAAVVKQEAKFDTMERGERRNEVETRRYVQSVLDLMRIDQECVDKLNGRVAGMQRSRNIRAEAAATAATSRDKRITSATTTSSAADDAGAGAAPGTPTTRDRTTMKVRASAGTGGLKTSSSSGSFKKIQEMKRSMKKAEDPHTIALAIGREYLKFGQRRRAYEFLEHATTPNPVKEVKVSKLEEEMEKRKMERMDEKGRQRYIEKRAKDKEDAEAAKRERERRRMRAAHEECFVLKIAEGQPEKGAEHMREWLDMSCDEERQASLERVAEVCASAEGLIDKNYNMSRLLLDGSLGSVGDLRIDVLTELLRIEPTNPEYLENLGTLLAQRRQYKASQELLEKHVKHRPHRENKLQEMHEYKTRGYYLNQALRPPDLSVKVFDQWQRGLDEDAKHADEQDDFVDFDQCHKGTDVTLYHAPRGGWVDDSAYLHSLSQRPQDSIHGQLRGLQR